MRILVIEPSGISRKLLAALLTDFGHDVVTASTGQEALSLIHGDDDLNVILTSLEVPGHSGFEICWEARTVTKKRPLYIIAMSSSHDDSKLSEVLDSGADDYISKPPPPEQLQARLRAAERLLSVQRELIHLATYDQLSRLHNRRSFFENAEDWINGSRGDKCVSLVMLDIDHFKRVNDTYGHTAGDAAIKTIGEVLIETKGFAARLGGEEFALLLRDIMPTELYGFAEGLRSRIAAKPILGGGHTFSVTASLGAVHHKPGMLINHLIKAADVALYEAKRSGRDKVVLSNLGGSESQGLEMVAAS